MNNFIFRLFTRRIEVKISKIDDGNKRIEFLTKSLMKEMESQGLYQFDGICGSVMIFEHEKLFSINGELDFGKEN